MKPIIVFLATAGFSMAHAALAQDCQQLWVERNSYYKELGYCFKTQTAIEYFGNGGCHIRNESEVPHEIPLEIVHIFEQHGFIWGGKWYHYDTMHFEYRPEMTTIAK